MIDNIQPSGIPISCNTEHMKSMYKETKMFGDAKNAKNWLKNSFNAVIRDFRGRPLAIGKRAVFVSRRGSNINMGIVTILGYNAANNTVQIRHQGTSTRVGNVKIPTRLIVL